MVSVAKPWLICRYHVFKLLFIVNPWLIFHVVVYFNKSRSKTNYGLDFYCEVLQEAIISHSLTYCNRPEQNPFKGQIWSPVRLNDTFSHYAIEENKVSTFHENILRWHVNTREINSLI